MQLLTTIIALCASAVLGACMLSMFFMLLELIDLMIKRQPMARALRTCVSSFIESFPSMIAEATTITLVSFLIWSVI